MNKIRRRAANIVLIEDDQDDIEIFTEVLARISSNIILTTIQDGSTALKMLATGECVADLIVLDLKLPDIDGLELLKKLRRIPVLERTSVVVYSSEDNPSIIGKCEKLLIEKFIQKSSELSVIDYELRRCLNRYIGAENGK